MGFENTPGGVGHALGWDEGCAGDAGQLDGETGFTWRWEQERVLPQKFLPVASPRDWEAPRSHGGR